MKNLKILTKSIILLLLFSCNVLFQDSYGKVYISMSGVSRALLDTAVAKYRITVTGHGFSEIKREFVDHIELNILPGASRKFFLEAFNSSGELLYSGETLANILANEPNAVSIGLAPDSEQVIYDIQFEKDSTTLPVSIDYAKKTIIVKLSNTLLSEKSNLSFESIFYKGHTQGVTAEPSLDSLDFSTGPKEVIFTDSKGYRAAYTIGAAIPYSELAVGTENDITAYSGVSGTFYYYVDAGFNPGTFYGTDVYTTDSCLSQAVIHAGVLGNGESGFVKVITVADIGMDRYYDTSIRNGVTSSELRGPSANGAFIVEKLDSVPRPAIYKVSGTFDIVIPEPTGTERIICTYTDSASVMYENKVLDIGVTTIDVMTDTTFNVQIVRNYGQANAKRSATVTIYARNPI